MNHFICILEHLKIQHSVGVMRFQERSGKMKDELFYLVLALQDLLVSASEVVKGVLKFPI